jgi:hypothetical protein
MPVIVSLVIQNPEDLDLEYEIGCNNLLYIDGGAIPSIAPTGPGQKTVSFTFTPTDDAWNQTIVFTIAIRSPKFNKIVERGIVSIRCVSESNTDIRLQAILNNQNVTYTFSSTGKTSAVMGLTTDDWLIIIPTAEVSGQTIAYTTVHTGGNITSGSPTSVWLDYYETNTLTITVTAPDATFKQYSIVVPRGYVEIPGGSYTIADFYSLANSSGHIKLGGDITLVGPAATGPLIDTTPYSAAFVFDGAGHKIRNLKIETTGDAALIGVNLGIIENLTLENVTITSHSTASIDVAGLVGNNWGSIYRCSVSGTITATDVITDNVNGVGGLVGITMAGSNISECYSTATVRGVYHVGGLVGYASSGTIQNCYARGPVTGTSEVGGLVGTSTSPGIILNSYATNASSGLLLGLNSGTVTDCSYGPTPLTVNWNITNTLNPAYVWGIGSGINGGYPYLQYFGSQTKLP